MTTRLLPGPLAGLATLALLAACQAPPAPMAAGPVGAGAGARQAAVDQATIAACRQRAEEVYLTQNRATLFQRDQRDTPFSGGHVPSVTSRGLADRYSLDQMVMDCIRYSAERANATVQPDAPGATLRTAPGTAPVPPAPPRPAPQPSASGREPPPPPPLLPR
jgi:hypothetical protein